MRQTVLALVVVSLVALAGCSGLTGGPAETATPSNATTAQTVTDGQPTAESTTAMTTERSLSPTSAGTAAPTATPLATPTATDTPTETPTATETPTPTETETATATETETATTTETETATTTETETATTTETETATATPTETAESTIGPEPPLDAEALATSHEEGLQAAGSFVVNDSSTLRESEGGSETDRRGAQVDLGTNTAYQVSRPTDEATRYTYAEGATAYQMEVLEGFDEPSYEVDELGRPLAESLITGDRIYETVRAVDYERSGTVTRDGQQLAVYVANGSDSVDTDRPAFRGEEITEFSSTLVVDSETGVVHTLTTERTTDYLSSGEPVTIEETLRFSEVGSTGIDQPGWVADLKDRNE